MYIPVGQTTRIVDQHGEFHRSFSIPSWGVLTVADGSIPDDSQNTGQFYSLHEHQAKDFAGYCITHIRSHLGLPSSSGYLTASMIRSFNLTSSKIGTASLVAQSSDMVVTTRTPRFGIASWELSRVARGLLPIFVKTAADNLRSLTGLVSDLPHIVVEPRIAQIVNLSAHNVLKGLDSLTNQKDLTLALRASRQGMFYSAEVLHDDSLMGDTFFSLEFRLAVYLPLTVPLVFPIITFVRRYFLSLRSLQ